MNLELNDNKRNNIFDDVEIIVDPELEDESTVDINDYLNKHILQCRICGNMFPSSTVLDNDTECPICDSKSPNGFIYKGKLLNKKDKNNDDKETLTPEEQKAIDDLNDEVSDEIDTNIFSQGDFDNYHKNDLTDNMNEINQ